MHNHASLFISHGAPDLVLHDTAARQFLENAGSEIKKPKGIIIASAHFDAHVPAVVYDESPEMIYDFGGFDRRLREMVYPAPGEPDLAAKVSALFDEAGIDHARVAKRGYDHGTWVPLCLLYPDADIPIVQISIQSDRSAKHHYELGKALKPLTDEGYLVIGSGSMTHNLSEMFGPAGLKRKREDEEVLWARDFAEWVSDKIEERDHESLINFEEQAPYARENHPTTEHFLPLFVALGAGGEEGKRLHKSTEFAVLAMDAYAFG